jgi:hypothetical protein
MVVTVIGARGLHVQRRVAEDLECGIENVTILRLQMRVKHVLINSLVQKWNPRLVISSSVKVRHESSCRCGFSPRVPCQAVSNHWWHYRECMWLLSLGFHSGEIHLVHYNLPQSPVQGMHCKSSRVVRFSRVVPMALTTSMKNSLELVEFEFCTITKVKHFLVKSFSRSMWTDMPKWRPMYWKTMPVYGNVPGKILWKR